MEITGKIIAALPEVSGVSRSGNAWKKKEYVLETQETYPRKVHFTCFGDNADKIVLSVGQTATVSFDIESREYNGRWYTDRNRTNSRSPARSTCRLSFRCRRGSTSAPDCQQFR